LVGVVAQRLVRTLCPHCKQSATPNEDVWKAMTKPWKATLPKEIFEPVGCIECRETGFKGRQGIYEVMPFTEALQDYSEDKGDIQKLRQQAYKEGMRSLKLSGAQKVASGLTTINEVLRVAPESR
jgi:general secretion pathway protein E